MQRTHDVPLNRALDVRGMRRASVASARSPRTRRRQRQEPRRGPCSWAWAAPSRPRSGPRAPRGGRRASGGFPESPTQRRSPGLAPSPLVGLSPTHPGGSRVPWTGDAEAGARSPHGSWALGEMRPAEPVPIASHVLCPVSCGQAWGRGGAGGAAADCRGGRPLCSGCSLPRPPQTLGSHHAAACCEPRGVGTQAHAMGRGAPRGRDTVLSDHVQAMLQLPVTGKNLPLAKVLPGRALPKSGQCPAAPSPPASGWGVGGRGVGRGLGQGRGPLGLGRLAPRLWPRPLVAAPLFIFTKSMRPESRPPRPTLRSPGFQSW